jgi:serine O-acetyltransferase
MFEFLKKDKEKEALQYAIDAFHALYEKDRDLILEDLSRIAAYSKENCDEAIKQKLIESLSFRSIMLYRIQSSGNEKASSLFNKFRIVYPEAQGVEIYGEIGGGLRIVHNCCIISVERAGKNLSVGAFVVIGKRRGLFPTIGDNVTICANSTVIGNIHLGDNSIVGAASFVMRDVAAGEVVGGNPAATIRYENSQ